MNRYITRNFIACALAVSGILTTDCFIPKLSPVLAQTSSGSGLLDATMPYTILSIAKQYGPASIGKDGEGDPIIRGTIKDTKYIIYFYGCVDGKDCDDILFYAGWERRKDNISRTLLEINKWNADTRYGKGYLDEEGDPCLEMVVNIDYGVSRKNLEDSFNWWEKATTSFFRDIVED